jgi:hypothetical protein
MLRKQEDAMNLEGMASEILSTVGNFLNTILGGVVNLFNLSLVFCRLICAQVLVWLYLSSSGSSSFSCGAGIKSLTRYS